VANSSLVSVVDVAIHTAPNKAITEFDGQGGHRYERVIIDRAEGSNKLLAANSDAFHSSGCRSGPSIVDCSFGFTGDDYFNIHNTMQIVLNVSRVPRSSSSKRRHASSSSGATEDANEVHSTEARADSAVDTQIFVAEPLLDALMTSQYGFNTAYGTAVQFENVHDGDELELYHSSDLAEAGVVQVSQRPYRLTADRADAAAATTALASAGLAVAANIGAVVLWRVSLAPSAAADSIAAGMLVNMRGWDAGDALVTGSRFHDSYCTSGRIKVINLC
jgi:hypothetical protein